MLHSSKKSASIALILASLIATAFAAQKYEWASSYNTYEEVEITSWVDDVFGASIAAFVIAPLLLLGGVLLLIYNEKRAIRYSKSLKELLGSVFAARDSVDPQFNGRVIHTTARLQPIGNLSDEAFGVSLPAVRLARKVEMFQWVETSTSQSNKNTGGGTTKHTHYEYKMEWRESAVDSTKFKMPYEHQNPGAMWIEGATWTAPCVFGANYTLPEETIKNLSNFKLLTLNDRILELIRPEFQGRFRVFQNCLYTGDPTFPRIGDLRVSFNRIDPEIYSVIGQQNDSQISNFRSTHGDSLLIIKEGVHSAQELIAAEESSNRILLFVLRFIGWLLLFLGVAIMLDPIATVFDVLPFLGAIIRLGSTTFAFVVSLSTTLLIIALMWFWENITFAVLLLALALAAIFSSAASGNSKA